jgi:nucleoside diphosphate kinase
LLILTNLLINKQLEVFEMSSELAFVLINPYTIAKSRTGGIIARYLQRTDLRLAGARVFGPSKQLVEKYAELVRHADSSQPETCKLIADYILRSYAPDPATGKPRRVILLLFEGEDAVAKIWSVTGSVTMQWGTGQTIRDTFGDYIVDENGNVRYFEPAVLVAPTKERARASLSLWTSYSASDGGIIEHAVDVPDGEGVEKTLVLLKPDNFQFHTSRPGSIVDALSASGLRIIGMKKINMSVTQAEQFYEKIPEILKNKFQESGWERVAEALGHALGLEIPKETAIKVTEHLAPLYAKNQFEQLIRFMTGYLPSRCTPEDRDKPGTEECLAIVYKGYDAVRKIRNLVGATDPRKAGYGSIRREFGTDVMVNAAHASDSVQSAEREIAILKVAEDNITPLVRQYYP